MNVIPFAFDDFQVRVLTDDQGEPWFVAADICRALQLDRKSLERLDDDEKGVSSVHTLGGQQKMTTVNQSGLFDLVLGSRKPEARRFKRWVTHDVLPALSKTGKYSTQAGPVPTLDHNNDKLLEVVNRTLQQNEKLIEALVRLSNPTPEPQRVQFNPPCLVGVKAEVRREVLLDTLRAGPVVTDAYAQATGLTRNRVMSDVHDLRIRGIPVRTEYGLEGTTYIME